MFLRRYQRSKQGKTHTYYALVESVRTDAGFVSAPTYPVLVPMNCVDLQ